MSTLLLVPPDTRPPTLDFPKRLAEAVGHEVLIPPPEALPLLNQPGDTKALGDWLHACAPKAELLIISLETLCLGGLIPARRVATPLEQALGPLQVLTELKRKHPALRILACGVIVRVAHDNDPFEEKPYYGEYGAELRAYSEAFDRFERQRDKESERRLQRAIAEVPHDILDDWLATRKRNHQLHLQALSLLKERVIEHLCLTLDDTSTYSLAAHDRRGLEARADELRVWDRLDIYPGADEVPATLLARGLSPRPQAVFVRYSAALGAAAHLLYEDRPVGELVKAHVRAAGCVQVDTLAEAELVLAVNTPAERQAHRQPDAAVVDTPARHLPEFVDFIARTLQTGKRLTLADIAYPNGAELRLMRLCEGRVNFSHLSGYSAWNTAGNSLGGALAMGVLAPQVRDRAIWTEALFNRLVDDYLYQASVRQAVAEDLTQPSPFDLGVHRHDAEARIDTLLRPLAEALWERHFADQGLTLHWQAPRLAWPRLFTGVFPLTVTPKEPS